MRILIALLILGIVILFHELGHFLLAKANHVKVLEFALGMGPTLFSFQKGDTVYALKALPFGGSCSMLGEDAEEEVDESGSFQKAALWRRALIVAGGPLFNYIMAFACSLILVGVLGADPATVVSVAEDSPAYAAGLREGDRIVRYEGNGIANASELYIDVLLSDIPTDRIDLTFEREGKRQKIRYTPQSETDYKLGFYFQDTEEQNGVQIVRTTKNSVLRQAGVSDGDVLTKIDGQTVHTVEEMTAYLDAHPLTDRPVDIEWVSRGKAYSASGLVPQKQTTASLGFSFNMARQKQNFAGWISYSFGEVRYWIHVVIKSLASLFNGTFGINDMSGPVGIVGTIGDAYEEARPMGIGVTILTLLNVITLLSANLGTMNLLPFPALDGGRLFLMLIEAIRRKPADPRLEGRINYVGLLVLLAFMLYVTAHDIFKLL